MNFSKPFILQRRWFTSKRNDSEVFIVHMVCPTVPSETTSEVFPSTSLMLYKHKSMFIGSFNLPVLLRSSTVLANVYPFRVISQIPLDLFLNFDFFFPEL